MGRGPLPASFHPRGGSWCAAPRLGRERTRGGPRRVSKEGPPQEVPLRRRHLRAKSLSPATPCWPNSAWKLLSGQQRVRITWEVLSMPCPVPAHPGETDLVRNWWRDGFTAPSRSVARTTLAGGSGGPGRTRTDDQVVMSHSLLPLSYGPLKPGKGGSILPLPTPCAAERSLPPGGSAGPRRRRAESRGGRNDPAPRSNRGPFG